MKRRFLRVLKPTVILLAVGFLYTLLHHTIGLNVPCPIYAMTGLYCPGCGVSRLCWHLMKGEWAEALSSNVVIFCLLPSFILGMGVHLYRYIRYGSSTIGRAENAVMWAAVVILLVFAVVRNILPWDILVP